MKQQFVIFMIVMLVLIQSKMTYQSNVNSSASE